MESLKVQHFQLFEKIKKYDCAPSPTVPHLPLPVTAAPKNRSAWFKRVERKASEVFLVKITFYGLLGLRLPQVTFSVAS